MGYLPTTALGMKLADPSTIQAFETVQVNANFVALETGIVADRSRISDVEGITAAVNTTDLAFTDFFNTTGINNGTAILTRKVAAQGKPVILIIQVATRHGGAGQNTGGAIIIDSDSGTWVARPGEDRTVANTGNFAAWTGTWILSIGSTVAPTLTVKSSSTANELWRGEIITTVVPTSKVN